jgi:hypothetical protein
MNFPSSFDEVVTALQPWNHTLRELSFAMYDMVLPRSPRHLRDVHLLRKFQGLKSLVVQAGCFDFYGHLGPQDDALTSTLPPSMGEADELDEANGPDE